MPLAACVHLFWGRGRLEYIIEDMWVGLDKEVILSIPLFILCGNVMTRGSIAQRLISILAVADASRCRAAWRSPRILSCAVFAAISGSSIVTMLAIGSVMYPAMRQAGYDNKFSLGAIMSGGTLGIIIPPSIPMIIYGLVTETIGDRPVRCGFRPGHPADARARRPMRSGSNWSMPTQRFSLAEFITAFKNGIWAVMMPVILLGGIYSGYFTATEAAAVALCLRHAGRGVHPQGAESHRLLQCRAGSLEARRLAVSGACGGAQPQHHADRAPRAAALVDLMQGYISSPLMFMLLVNILLLIVGCLMTTGEAILVLAPLLAPIAAVLRLRQGAVRPDHDPEP